MSYLSSHIVPYASANILNNTHHYDVVHILSSDNMQENLKSNNKK